MALGTFSFEVSSPPSHSLSLPLTPSLPPSAYVCASPPLSLSRCLPLCVYTPPLSLPSPLTALTTSLYVRVCACLTVSVYAPQSSCFLSLCVSLYQIGSFFYNGWVIDQSMRDYTAWQAPRARAGGGGGRGAGRHGGVCRQKSGGAAGR